MKKKVTALSAALAVVLIALVGEARGWNIKKKFLSSIQKYKYAKDDKDKISLGCGKTFEINNYDPPYLHLELSDDLKYKKGYV